MERFFVPKADSLSVFLYVLNGRCGVEDMMYRVLYIERTMRIDIGDKDRNGDGGR